LTEEEAEAWQSDEAKRISAELWEKASDLCMRKAAEKEVLRKQLKECSRLAQEQIESRVEHYLRTHEESMTRKEHAKRQILEETAALDKVLHRKRKDYEDMTGISFNSASLYAKRQKGADNGTLDRPDTASKVNKVKHEIVASNERLAMLGTCLSCQKRTNPMICFTFACEFLFHAMPPFCDPKWRT
jgi:hypothetical protein